jgi:hypothetical protein
MPVKTIDVLRIDQLSDRVIALGVNGLHWHGINVEKNIFELGSVNRRKELRTPQPIIGLH